MSGRGMMPVRALAAWLLLAVGAYADPLVALREDFEGPVPSWRVAGGDVRFRLDRHERVAHRTVTPQGGAVCEYLELTAAAGGTWLHLAFDLDAVPVIEELRPTLVVSSNRAGIQLLARVVLPRAIDPQTGQPLTTLVRGSSYNRVGTWEQLRLDDCHRLVDRQVWALRAQYGSEIDTRGAYINQLLLNAYTGEGTTQLWIDSLEVSGAVAATQRSAATLEAADARNPARLEPHSPAVGNAARNGSANTVELRGPVVAARGRPVFPRVVQYQGEPLESLRRLGFNAVWVAAPPARELLDEAARSRMWLIGPPPLAGAAVGGGGELGPWYDVVLAWDLGSGLTTADLDQVRGAADAIRAIDRVQARPLVLHAEAGLRTVGRQADFLRLERAALGSSAELAGLVGWIRGRLQLARPGTPAWFTVQTQPAAAVVDQSRLMAGTGAISPEVEPEQVRVIVNSALAAGVRGLVFRSASRLDADDPATRARAALLELINLELEILETWASTGTFRDQLSTAVPEVRAALLHTDRAQLLLPMWLGQRAQLVPGPATSGSLSLVVPGVPESSDAYELAPGQLRPLRLQRVTGGVRVTLDEFNTLSTVVLSQDPSVVAHLTQRAARDGLRMAQLERDLAAHKYQRVATIDGQLASLGVRRAEHPRWLATAAGHLQQAERLLNTGNLPAAQGELRRATRPLALIERQHWEQLAGTLTTASESPPALLFDTLPVHVRLAERIRAVPAWNNLLPEGEVESLGRMLEAGWRHMQHPAPGLRADAELSPAVRLLPGDQNPHDPRSGLNQLPGRYCLRLAGVPVDPQGHVGQVESPAVWVVSPAVHVESGQLIRIRGWVHVPHPIAGSDDGLLILDTLGGEPLAARFTHTAGWQPFTLYRVAAQSGPVALTIALCGAGQALVDDLAIEIPAPATAAFPFQRR